MANPYKILKLTIAVSTILLGTTSAGAINGSWRGDLDMGFSSLPLVFNFSDKGDSTTCTLDSPNQNVYGLPLTVDYVSTDSVAVSAGSIGATFAGKVTTDEIKGTFSQRGYKFPLILKPEIPLSERRPQTPQPPFPYQAVDTTFYSADGTALCGTLTFPSDFDKGKTPMCVFVTGSGPQNRDEELFEHKPFAVISDFLARNGVATFRFDDRGTGESKGDYAAATIGTFRDDAKAALSFARTFTNGSCGIIGHSEGGTLALMLAQEGLPDFVVSLAGMAISGKETILAQNKRLMERMGFDKASTDNSMTLINVVFDEIIRQNKDRESAPIDIDVIASSLGVSVPPAIMQNIKSNVTNATPYFASMLTTDVRKGMSKISCPVLALNGSLDTQVSANDNLDAISNGIVTATVVMLPGLNHLFQHAATGEMEEYAQIKETISPEVLSAILSYIRNLK